MLTGPLVTQLPLLIRSRVFAKVAANFFRAFERLLGHALRHYVAREMDALPEEELPQLGNVTKERQTFKATSHGLYELQAGL